MVAQSVGCNAKALGGLYCELSISEANVIIPARHAMAAVLNSNCLSRPCFSWCVCAIRIPRMRVVTTIGIPTVSPVSRMPMPNTRPVKTILGHPIFAPRNTPKVMNATPPKTAMPMECSMTVVKKTPLNVAAIVAMPHCHVFPFSWRMQYQADAPRNNRETRGR